MAARFLRGSYGSLVLTVIALASGVALVCAIDLVNRSVARAFLEIIDTMAGRATLQVTSAQGGLMPEEIASSLANLPGVDQAVPLVSATAFLTDGTGESLSVFGVDVTNEDSVRLYEARSSTGDVVEDPLTFVSQPNSLILTRTFASRRGLAQDSTITLDTPTGHRTFVIRGLLEPKGVARVYGGNLAVMDLPAAEIGFTRPGYVTRVDVVTQPTAGVEEVSERIRATLPPGLRVDAPSQRRVDLNKVIASLQVLLSGMGLVALVAAFLIAFNRLASFFERRAWQLGVMAAVGVREGVIWLELLKESLLVGVAGVVIGIPLGVALGRLLLPVVATTAALNYKLVAPETDLAIRVESIVLAAVLGIVAAVLAASLPAWRAVRLGIHTTLRSWSRELPAVRQRAWTALFGIALGAAAATALQSFTHLAGFGLAATGLIAVAIAVAAQPLLTPVTALLGPAVRWAFGPSGRLAMAAIRENPRRMALTAATLGVGLGSVFWLWIVARSFEISVVDVLSQAIRADLIVTSSHVSSGFIEAPLDDSLVPAIATSSSVSRVAGWRTIEWPYENDSVAISAYDAEYFRHKEFGDRPLQARRSENAWEDVARGDAMIVSTNFAANFGVSLGDVVTLATPSGLLSLPVAGIAIEFVSPRGTIEISRELFSQYWHDHHVNQIFVRLTPGTGLDRAREAIAARFRNAYDLRILSAAELMEWFAEQVRTAFSVVDVLAGLVLFVVLVGMADSLTASVVDRTREFGTMLAEGVRANLLGRIVVIEAAILGSMGLLLAICGGTALGVLWAEATFTYLLGWALELHFPSTQIAQAAVVTLLVCTIAAWLPARRAGRIEPTVALRHE